jgi:hypothetical protein
MNLARQNRTADRQLKLLLRASAFVFFVCNGALAGPVQPPDPSVVIRGVDAAVKARFEAIAGFTVTEHYAVFRNSDELHPAAEMTVKTTYRKDAGKSYTVLSQSGSSILRKLVLFPLLDEEKRVNEPAIRETFWFTSANYHMQVVPGELQRVDGRGCLTLAITPRHKAPNLIQGTLCVDPWDYSIVQLQGTASKSPSVFTNPPHVMRQYAYVSGFAQATHARAVSDSPWFGRTIVKIDYQNYETQLRPTH